MNQIERLVVTVAFMLAVTGARAQETPAAESDQGDAVPEWPERVFRFEVSDQPLVLQDFKARPGVVWPRFAATFSAHVSNSAYEALFCVSRSGDSPEKRTQALLSTASASRLSQQQLEFVKTSPWLCWHKTPKPFSNREEYTLYAMSEADARLMVEAVFEVMDAPGRADFEEMKRKLLDRRARLEQARKKLAEVQREKQKSREVYDAVRKTSGYENRDSAGKDLARLDVSLRSLEVTIAGINAKIGAIEKLKTGQGASLGDSTRLMLDRLHFEQDIELAGALAQKEVLVNQRKRAQAHLDAWKNHDAVAKNAEEADKNAFHQRIGVENWLKRLKDPSSSVGRVNQMDNVVIQPIQYPAE